MNKRVRVILSPEAEEVYRYLNQRAADSKLERSILNAVNKKVELIKINSHYGEPVSKDKIPHIYRTKYDINNLFRVELPQFWRMLYSLTHGESEIEIIAFILEIHAHDAYDKRFDYRRK